MAEAKTSTNTGPTRCGFVAILGAPNAGKSTLTNTFVGAKVTIVSHKVQTTRVPIRGIAIEGASHSSLSIRRAFSVPNANSIAPWSMLPGVGEGCRRRCTDGDAAKGIDEDVERILEKLAGDRACRLLVLNKIDRVEDKTKLLALAAELNKRVPFERVFMIAAVNGDGTVELKSYLASSSPRARGITRRTTSRTRRCGCSPLRSRARRSTSGCTTSCRIRPWSRRRRGRNSRTGLCGSSRRSLWNVIVKRVSCSARAAHHQAHFVGVAYDIDRGAGASRSPFPVREGARGMGKRS